MEEEGNHSISEAVQEVAEEQLGVTDWDLPEIFRETMESAADTGTVYWVVLVLSGAIATLGLALDSSAVVIGAMLVAPLLAPIVGLALALAIGDGRLVVQLGLVVIGSTVAVVLASALLTLLLPFHSITLEISARARPTTLDLAIAILSGLIGAVVTVSRGTRLSAAIPGVAIAVALIPPLGVSGFGIASGMNFDLIYGSMLLYGANLAGIILSGMVVFLLIGMHRPEMRSVVAEWHEDDSSRRLSNWVQHIPGLKTMGVEHPTWARLGLVAALVIGLGFPLSASLGEITREVRVERAIGSAEGAFEIAGRSSLLDRRLSMGQGVTEVRLRVATTEWFTGEDVEAFEAATSIATGENVRLTLEQIPAAADELEGLASLLPKRAPVAPIVPVEAAPFNELIAPIPLRVDSALTRIVLPPGMQLVDMELSISNSGALSARGTYQSRDTLGTDAAAIVAQQLRQALGIRDLTVALRHIELEADSTAVEGP